MSTTIPPLSHEDIEYLEKKEFDESLGFALNSVISDIKLLLLRSEEDKEKLAEYLKSRNVQDLQQYSEIGDEQLKHLGSLDMLTLPSLAGYLSAFTQNDRVRQLIEFSFIELDKCEKIAERNQELTIKLAIVKTRITALILGLTGQKCDVHKITSDYIKNAIIELYIVNSLPIPEALKSQLAEDELIEAENPMEIDDDVMEELSQNLLIRVTSAIKANVAEKMDGAHPKFIEKVTNERTDLIIGALTSEEKILQEAMKAYEEDPSIERIVKEILGIKKIDI